ncbi:hypothetical protein ACIA2T_00395 [Amycolatopsis japonica]|uniref:hypothetical protein n=1 Tax=Amycolatopsis japonica TaxID=208439 RepID=UPI0037972900
MTTIAESAQVCGNELIHELMELQLDPDQFVIFGSAPLLAHGLRTIVHDLDIVARGDAMDFARKNGTLRVGRYSGDPVWHLNNGRLQFSAGWITNSWDANQLIDNAEIIQGLRFACLSDVLRYKQELLRKKDLADIARIQSYLCQ